MVEIKTTFLETTHLKKVEKKSSMKTVNICKIDEYINIFHGRDSQNNIFGKQLTFMTTCRGILVFVCTMTTTASSSDARPKQPVPHAKRLPEFMTLNVQVFEQTTEEGSRTT